MRDPARLLRQLNETCTRTLEEAANLCHNRAHAEILPEHWLLKLVEHAGSDVELLLRRYDIDRNALWDQLINALDRAPRALHGKPGLSPELVKWLESAWMIASLNYQDECIRSLHLLQALQRAPQLLRISEAWPLLSWNETQLERVRTELDKISCEGPTTTATSASSTAKAQPDSDSVTRDPVPPPLREALQRFTTNLTAKARAGRIDPIFGREAEIRQMEDILARRRKNNPILVGDPGVGKTALVEGLALKIAQGEVSDALKPVDILSLDMGLLQAGAGIKGEFEQRLKNVIEAIQQSTTPILLFIDEAHTLIGAGNPAGGGDAANLLKPALARGELRTIAATTWSEFKQYFERDAALERRFQPVKVDEPDDDRACQMLRGLQKHYARHHGVHIQDEAVRAAVELSRRYIPGRQLPDKAVDLLDTAAARVRMALDHPPTEVSLLEGQQAALRMQISALEQDSTLGNRIDTQQLDLCIQTLNELSLKLEQSREQYARQRDVARQVLEARQQESAPSQLQAAMQQLAQIQGDSPLLSLDVDTESIARIISDWTGVPAGSLLTDELTRLLSLESYLNEVIIGQEEATSQLACHLRTAKAGLMAPDKPFGVFLLTGPSGVGKTETARALARQLCGSEEALIAINLSEYQEAHTVSQLKGAPPGYVGYGQGGVLTEAVRQRPYSVILLDETEKAHRDVLNLFYQVFDRGFMRDGEGREINFCNTVILMTSNLGSQIILDSCQHSPDITSGALLEQIRPELLDHLQPALLARMQTLVYRGLDSERVTAITQQKLQQLSSRIQKSFGCPLTYDDELAQHIGQAGAFHDSGARYVDHVLQQQILPDISMQLLRWQREHNPAPQRIHLESNAGEIVLKIES